MYILFRNPECRKLASSSKDGDVRIWDTVTGHTVLSLTGHSKAVTCVKWGGTGLIYTSSQDRTIKVQFQRQRLALVIPIKQKKNKFQFNIKNYFCS